MMYDRQNLRTRDALAVRPVRTASGSENPYIIDTWKPSEGAVTVFPLFRVVYWNPDRSGEPGWELADSEKVESFDQKSKLGLVMFSDETSGVTVLVWGRYIFPIQKAPGDPMPIKFKRNWVYWLKKSTTGLITDDIEEAFPPGNTDVTRVTQLCTTYNNGVIFWNPTPMLVVELCEGQKTLIPAYVIPNP